MQLVDGGIGALIASEQSVADNTKHQWIDDPEQEYVVDYEVDT